MRRRLIAAAVVSFGVALTLAATASTVARISPPDSIAGIAPPDSVPAIAPPDPIKTGAAVAAAAPPALSLPPLGFGAARPSLAELVSSGIVMDGNGGILSVFGVDPAVAREIFYPVTMKRSLPADYVPKDLVSIASFGVPSNRVVLRIVGPDLETMQKDSGNRLNGISGYRSYAYQVEVQERYVTKEMRGGLSRDAALIQIRDYSAPPGYSQHQLAIAIDFNEIEQTFDDTQIAHWLMENAWKYGFVMSYPRAAVARSGYQYEPWHYRWVGRPLARLMWEQGYLNDSQRTPDDYLEAIWGLLSPDRLLAGVPQGPVPTQILATLRAYEAIPIVAPARDSRGLIGGISASETIPLQVRTPYWINDEPSEAHQAQRVAAAPAELRRLFNEIPLAVRQGKGSPEQIRQAVQTVVNAGFIRAAEGGGSPGAAEIESWMRDFGIGVDCSGLVYEALSRIDRVLAADGMGGLARPLGGPPTFVGSRALASGGEPVAAPGRLRPGDMMYRAPYESNPVGHIRIVDDVRIRGQEVMFHTAETRGDGIPGPTARWWRYRDASRFADLEELVDAQWRPAEQREQKDVYSRRLPPLAPSAAPGK